MIGVLSLPVLETLQLPDLCSFSVTVVELSNKDLLFTRNWILSSVS